MFDPSTRVLIVDDMKTMLKLVTRSLNELGYTNILEARDGRVAWETLLGANPPVGLIISDWNMPSATGIDLLKRVRAEGQYKHLPFILLTAEAEKTQVAEAVQAGVTNYLVKPFTTPLLREKIEAAYKKVTGV